MSRVPLMPLDQAIREANRIQTLFICNQYKEAVSECEKNVDQHFLFQVIGALFKSINGVVTFQECHMEDALQSIQRTLTEVDAYRRKRGRFSRMIWSANYEDYTDTECQAEGCYSVMSACMAGMTILCEKTFVGLLKAGYWGKTALDVLRECKVIAKKRHHWDSEESKECFCHGVFVGLGLYNLVVSFLPKRILSLLKFFGFHGDRNLAFKYLIQVSYGKSIWAPVAAVNVLSHHCHAEFIVGLGSPDVPLVQKILQHCLKRYPGSGFFLIFEGTVRLMTGQAVEAIEFYEKSCQKFEQWPEWQYVCHWFITWCHAVECNWQKALEHTKILVDNCNWSRCVFTYQYAAMLKMIEEETSDPEKKAGLRREIDHHLRNAPTFKRSFVGKTIFVEKFVTKRCQIYWCERERLTKDSSVIDDDCNGNKVKDRSGDAFMLPILDLFLFWNIFFTFKSAPSRGIVFLKRVDAKLQVYTSDSADQEKHFYLVLMKGIILKNIGDQDRAIECLRTVLDNEHRLKRYSHLAPLACLELGMLFKQIEDYRLAEHYLLKAMNDYAHYLNETTVHIRAHSVIEVMRAEQASPSSHRKLSIASLTSLGSRLSFVLALPGLGESKE